MEIYLYNMRKELNSTARPAPGAGSSYTGALRTGSSFESPFVSFSFPADVAPTGYNYAYIPSFRRYYWIGSWSVERGLWWASMRVDVLATYRDEIMNSEQYVLRSASEYDGKFIDTAYPASLDYTVDIVEGRLFPDGEHYLVGIISKGGDTGVINYYAMTPTQFETFSNVLLGDFLDAVSQGVTEISADLTKVIFNPMQYIVSVRWYPFPISVYTSGVEGATEAVTELKIGWWTAPNVSATHVKGSGLTVIRSTIIEVPQHPDADARGIYMNGSPFSTYTLYFLPFFSGVELNANSIATLQRQATADTILIYVTLTLDTTTGVAYVVVDGISPTLTGDEYFKLAVTTGEYGATVPLAQASADVYHAAYTFINDTLADAGKNIGKAVRAFKFGKIGTGLAKTVDTIADVAMGVLDAVGAGAPTISSTGAVSCRTNSERYATFEIVHRSPAEDYNARQGRPLMAKRQLSSLSGFTQCASAHVDADGILDSELNALESMLESGVYLE